MTQREVNGTNRFDARLLVATLALLTLVFLVFALLVAYKSVAIVPQSEEFVVERFGRYRQTLAAGINLLIPFLDRVEHKVLVLERL